MFSFCIPFFSCWSTMFSVSQTILLGPGERDGQEEGCKIGNEGGIAEIEKEIYKLVLRDLKWGSVFLFRYLKSFGLW